jgi:hypothetical protein
MAILRSRGSQPVGSTTNLKLFRYDEPMTNSAAAPVSQTFKRSRQPRIWLLLSALASLSIAVIIVFVVNAHWPYRYRIIKPMLEEVLGSQVTIAHFHRTYFPKPGFMATGITLDRNPTPGAPSLGTVSSISVQGNWLDLLMVRDRVRQVDLTGLHLVIPAAGSAASHKDFPPGSSSSFSGPQALIDQLCIHDSTLDVIRAEGGTYSFPIRLLTLRNLQKGRVLSYSVDMRNPRPRGHIVSAGSFGPLNPLNLGATPVSGHFTFEQVDLHDIGDIGGTLSSAGNFQGNLARMQAEASMVTRDFAVGGGKPTPITTSAHCTINALSGDVLLNAIDAKFGSTTIHVQGGIVGSPKVIDVDISVPAGRAEDVLRPFLRANSPIAGTVWLESHAHVDAAGHGVPFLDRLHVDGSFDVPAERLTDRKTKQELSAFSERAQKAQPFKVEAVPDPPPGAAAQNAERDVVSSLKGKARIEKGSVTTQRLELQIPGSSVDLHGEFSLRDGTVHMAGNVHMQTDVSHAATGFKSILLKPLIPFFKKRMAGAVIPIAVTGKPGRYKVSQDVLDNK